MDSVDINIMKFLIEYLFYETKFIRLLDGLPRILCQAQGVYPSVHEKVAKLDHFYMVWTWFLLQDRFLGTFLEAMHGFTCQWRGQHRQEHSCRTLLSPLWNPPQLVAHTIPPPLKTKNRTPMWIWGLIRSYWKKNTL